MNPVERLARWRKGIPFQVGGSNGTAECGAVLSGEELWQLRLTTADLDEQRLLALLTEPMPQALDAISESLCENPDSPWDQERPFLVTVGCLLERAYRNVCARMDELLVDTDSNVSSVFADREELVRDLVRNSLAVRLDTMLHRSMVAELAKEHAANPSVAKEPADRFAEAVARFTEPGRRRALFDEFPLLAQRLHTVAELWQAFAVELLERLVTDLPELLTTLGAPASLGHLATVRAGLGDSHRSSRSVAVIEFSSGWKAVYKPRPFGVDAHFQDLLEWVNERTDGLNLRTVRCFDRGDYGWMEYVQAWPCTGSIELRTFYRRQGALLALLYVLHASDANAENLIAAGDQPVLIDLETLLQPRLEVLRSGNRSVAETAADELFGSSVIHAGLLPAGPYGWADRSGMSVQDGAGASSIRIPHVEAPGTDRMRIRLRKAAVPRGDNQPDHVVRLRDYVDSVLVGFTEVYTLLGRNRDALTRQDGPLAAFRTDQVRVLLRDTSTYGLILGMSFHPRLLRNRWDLEEHFDLLWREVATKPGLAAVTESERRALWAVDIPAFDARVDGTEVLDDQGAVVLDTGVTSGWQLLNEALERLGDEDLARQIWLIRACMLSNGVRWDEPVAVARDAHAPAATPIDDEPLYGVAQAVAERLVDLAVGDSEGAVWLGVRTGAETNWQVGVTGPDLYAGGLGIALFLGHYAEVSGDAEYRDLARRAAGAAVQQLRRGRFGRGTDVLGLIGLGGAVYALAQLGALWADDGLIAIARSLVAAMPPLIARDEDFAVIDGAAGALLGAGTLSRISGDADILDVIRDAADRLLTAQGAGSGNAAWMPRRMHELGLVEEPLAGYGHGASGIASALVCASELLGDETYLDAALLAVDYERRLFEPKHGNWRDIRRFSGHEGPATEKVGDWTDTEGNTIAWCHGAVGIGLTRLHILRHCADDGVESDMVAALETTLRSGFGNGNSLCHGDFGSLELAVTVASDRADGELWTRLRRHAATVVDSITEEGWRCGIQRDLEVPGLYNGLAGIGFGALRVSAAPGVPSPFLVP
ncbi:lanthionine synthetase [Nocardia neocaledoniensis NBRC 108232]|uniref:type 2 lanthipeptide synthetase LanM family protein n=1 Tax=Nocardia neocaledoniensis TaxID=236511 RepID=UPI0011912B30|nr:type 2 lanthipeptide synthetase LanM family protein [Nocardia neocaledoniensis]GEM29016.1 lanthionine synthetase [Nocardia neocaledoniensis NBRC 108232]